MRAIRSWRGHQKPPPPRRNRVKLCLFNVSFLVLIDANKMLFLLLKLLIIRIRFDVLSALVIFYFRSMFNLPYQMF